MAAGVALLPALALDGASQAGRGISGTVAIAASRHVVVEQGDSLWEIARQLSPEADPRETVVKLRLLNGLESNLIHPGQVLLVPQDI
ncbi:MAG: LysM peptidoglycan-binding domain-containing protein [Candidatus Nanopelagicales bacterium]